MAYNPNSTTYTTKRVTVTGTLGSNRTTITYIDNSGETHSNVSIATKIFKDFNDGDDVEITISSQKVNSEELDETNP